MATFVTHVLICICFQVNIVFSDCSYGKISFKHSPILGGGRVLFPFKPFQRENGGRGVNRRGHILHLLEIHRGAYVIFLRHNCGPQAHLRAALI